MRLTKNFFLNEFVRSQTAARNGIDMTPPPIVVENIRQLCEEILQPLRDSLGVSITVTSGYRPPVLNTLIGGSPSSAHLDGRAADIVCSLSPLAVARQVVHLKLPYDQVIHEFGQWTHIAIAESPRGQALTAHRSGGQVQYALGLHELDKLA